MCLHSATNHEHIKPRSVEIKEALARDNFLQILRDPEPLDDEDIRDLMHYRDTFADAWYDRNS